MKNKYNQKFIVNFINIYNKLLIETNILLDENAEITEK